MKPFVFDHEEYQDLDSLGIAFSNHFDLALEAIQEKSFLKFIKKFKQHKKNIKQILFQSRYLQNALSMIIYLITDEHILYIGHKRYHTLQKCLEDVYKNTAILFFAMDHGFSNTILKTIEDEKLKSDIQAFEENPKDGLALSFMEKYYKMDSIEASAINVKSIQLSNDPFKIATQEFKTERVQLSLALKYSLKEVIELRRKNSPVFKGLSLVYSGNENVLEIVEKSFYLSLMETWKTAKYKGRAAKGVKRRIKSYSKAYKKYYKMGVQQKLFWHESFHSLYLEWIDYFKLGKILLKDSSDEPSIPYCDTYISPNLQRQKSLERDKIEKPYQSSLKPVYDLRQLNKSFRNHSFFVYWSILLAIFTIPSFVLLSLIPAVKEKFFSLLANVFHLELPDDTFFIEVTTTPLIIQILFYVGIGIVVVLGVAILILKQIGRSRYNALCRLAYYRKNEFVLKEKEYADYQKINKKEAKYAKSIDRFYRFYGGVSMAGLSLLPTISMLIVINFLSFFVYKDLAVGIHNLFVSKIYFIGIPPVICMGLGFLRHKKTAWSAIFAYGISLILSAVLAYLSIIF